MRTVDEICEGIQENADLFGRGTIANIDAKALISEIQQLRNPLPELNENQVRLLKDFYRMWEKKGSLNLSCKTSAVLAVLETNACHKVFSKEIDEVVQVFLSE